MLVKFCPDILPSKARAVILAIGVLGALTLQGCASGSAMQQNVSTQTQTTQQRIEALQAQQQQRQQAEQAARGARADAPWVATQRVPFQMQLPARFNERIVVNEPAPTSMRLVLGRVSEMTGIRFSVDNDVFETRSRGEAGAGGGGGGGAGARGGAPRALGGGADSAQTPVAVATPGVSFQMQPGEDQMISLSFNGTVRGLLDTIAGSTGLQWRYDRVTDQVVWFRFETRTLRIAMVPGAVASQAALGVTAGGAQTTSGVSGSVNFWESLRQAVTATLSAQGAFTLNEATGLLTVRDRPDVLQRVEDYVNRANANFARQVSIEVAVYRVAITDSERKGLNFELALRNSAGTMGFQLNSPRGETTGMGTMILNSPTGGTNPWAGSQLFLDLLSQLGQTSVVTSSTLHTINNQPVPLRVVRRINYLREVAQSGSGDTTTATLTPGELEVGFNVQMLPHVQENGKDLVMQIMMTLSSLDRMDTFASAGNSIQLPQVSSRDFLQRVWLRSGQSLLLVGFEQDEQGVNNAGMFGTQTWFGGTNAATRQRERLVIVLTPVVRNMVSPS